MGLVPAVVRVSLFSHILSSGIGVVLRHGLDRYNSVEVKVDAALSRWWRGGVCVLPCPEGMIAVVYAVVLEEKSCVVPCVFWRGVLRGAFMFGGSFGGPEIWSVFDLGFGELCGVAVWRSSAPLVARTRADFAAGGEVTTT